MFSDVSVEMEPGAKSKVNAQPLVFVAKPPERFFCTICHALFVEPARLSSCDHVFCKSCIQQWLRTSLSCPVCRVAPPNQRLIPAIIVQECINELLVYCPSVIQSFKPSNDQFHDGDGKCVLSLCAKPFKYSEFATHAKICRLQDSATWKKNLDAAQKCISEKDAEISRLQTLLALSQAQRSEQREFRRLEQSFLSCDFSQFDHSKLEDLERACCLLGANVSNDALTPKLMNPVFSMLKKFSDIYQRSRFSTELFERHTRLMYIAIATKGFSQNQRRHFSAWLSWIKEDKMIQIPNHDFSHHVDAGQVAGDADDAEYDPEYDSEYDYYPEYDGYVHYVAYDSESS